MSASSSDTPAERPRLLAIVLWTAFVVLLVAGVWLYVRYGGRVVPFLDAAGDR